MVGHPAHAEDEAGVLDPSIGVVEPGAHRAHLRSLRLLQHGGEPVGLDDLGVVVEEDEVLAPGLGSAEVVEGGEVERSRVRIDPPLVGDAVEARERLRLGAVVVQHDDLVARVARLLLDAPEALLEQGPPVPRRDDDGHERRSGELVPDRVQPGPDALHPGFVSAPPHRVLDRLAPRLVRERLGRGGGGGMWAMRRARSVKRSRRS